TASSSIVVRSTHDLLFRSYDRKRDSRRARVACDLRSRRTMAHAIAELIRTILVDGPIDERAAKMIEEEFRRSAEAGDAVEAYGPSIAGIGLLSRRRDAVEAVDALLAIAARVKPAVEDKLVASYRKLHGDGRGTRAPMLGAAPPRGTVKTGQLAPPRPPRIM